ncbi:SPL family radical SAM protein [Vulcanisaeta thermophila]|uniref:SPL family radical SAM protein n=1 Tax=Vulcanisaeta thermophila TaxID=867917 RepID=UPI0009FF355C|nr:radical SAM protein [Vulcanisaeta thermophila]
MSFKPIVREIRVRNALNRSGLPEYDYSLNPYLGCQHGCTYCYAPEFTKGEPGKRWGYVVYVKVNLLEVLSREVRRFRPGIVGVSTITDPYQPVESRYRLTRGSIDILCNAGFHVSIQTKSALVIRDLDLLLKCEGQVDVGFTITTLGDDYRVIEPMAAHPMARAAALRRLASHGIRTWIFLGPIIPMLNDDPGHYKPIIKLAHETHSEVVIDRLRVKGSIAGRLGAHGISVSVDNGWWVRKVHEIKGYCRELGVNCITSDEEWRSKGANKGLLSFL